MDTPQTVFSGFLPDLEPVIAHEITEYGWRGLAGDGEILETRSANGHKVDVPDFITVVFRGKAIGTRDVIKPSQPINIDDYLCHFNNAVSFYKLGNLMDALAAANASIAIAPTLRARFNRAMILLASKRWREGFDEYLKLEEGPPFIRPQVKEALARGLKPWRGEDLRGKSLLVMHAHGFGDTIQCLRYVRPLRQTMGVDVVQYVPPELDSIAVQFSAASQEIVDADYFCPYLHLLGHLKVEPDGHPISGRYIDINPELIAKWRERLGAETGGRKRIGVAWSVGKPSVGDYPREIEVSQLMDYFGSNAALYSVQKQLSPRTLFSHGYDLEDFADCAALMMNMDEIVTVDTAAVHLAGAIGHPNVKLLLSKWASWRWVKQWYPNVKICRQETDGDWSSALAQC